MLSLIKAPFNPSYAQTKVYKDYVQPLLNNISVKISFLAKERQADEERRSKINFILIVLFILLFNVLLAPVPLNSHRNQL